MVDAGFAGFERFLAFRVFRVRVEGFGLVDFLWPLVKALG